MISRREAIVLGSATAFAAACSPAILPAPPEVPLRVGTRWSARPPGPLPLRGDEGLPIALALSGTTVAPVIAGGGLRCELPPQHAAAYVMQELPSPVRRIGAVFGFGPGSPEGSLALVAWVPGTLDTHCHVAVTPDRWIASVALGGGVDEIGSGTLTSWPQDGGPRRIDVTFSGQVGVLDLPDGTRSSVTDPRLATIPGSRPGWEFYRNTAGGASTVFYETWAG